LKNKRKKFWDFKAKADDPNTGELMLYGDISSYESWWSDTITPKQFKDDLDALGDITNLNIYVNSGGGDVFAGQAIRSMLKRHSSYKTCYVDGLAASIASVILTACDKVVMYSNAMQMVHKCWSWAVGNADDMRKMAEDMDKIDQSIVAAYEEKTGLDKDEILELMKDETWMTAEEAVEKGFADEIEGSKNVAASLQDGFLILNGQKMDLSKFNNVPDYLKNLIKQNKDNKTTVDAPAMDSLTAAITNLTETIQGAGRTLSTANEQRITQSRDLLNEVLSQLEEEETEDSTKNKPEPVKQVPVDIYQKQILLNRRKCNV